MVGTEYERTLRQVHDVLEEIGTCYWTFAVACNKAFKRADNSFRRAFGKMYFVELPQDKPLRRRPLARVLEALL